MKYKGWIYPPAMRDSHEGRVWLKDHTPFEEADIQRAIE